MIYVGLCYIQNQLSLCKSVRIRIIFTKICNCKVLVVSMTSAFLGIVIVVILCIANRDKKTWTMVDFVGYLLICICVGYKIVTLKSQNEMSRKN